MSVTLTPGYLANIQLRDARSNILYQCRCTADEQVKEFIGKYAKSRDGYSLLQSAIFPLRTDNLKNYAEDLFLPTFIHYSSKVNNFVLKFLSSIFAVAFDIVTIPIRIITTPIQLYYNNIHEEKHPIINLIQNDHLAQNVIQNNSVNLCYEVQNVQMSNPTYESGNTYQKAAKSMIKGSIQIALKSLPGGIKKQSQEEEEKTSYLGMNDNWVVENYSKNSSSHYSFAC
jgi:hypothetical protein